MLLYGFRPASRENNPYAPWGGRDAQAAALIRLDGSSCVEVERRLLSQPTGRMTVDGRTEDLRNRALPWTEHVPMQVFRQVFALTLVDLAGLDDEMWGRVQDRIVGSMGASDVVPAREVAADLEREAGELWRPSRRGNQRIRDLRQEVRALRARRREALDRDVRLRALVAKRDRIRDELQDAREARQRERLAVERVQELLPVRRQLRRIAALRADAGPPQSLRGLPEDPAGHLAQLERERKTAVERRCELDGEMEEPRRAVASFGEHEAEMVARAGVITGFVARAEGLAVERARMDALEHELEDLDRRLETDTARLLSVSWDDAPADRLEAVPTGELRARVDDFVTASEEVRIEEESRRREQGAGTRHTGEPSWLWGATVAIAGGWLLTRGLVLGDTVTTVAGGLVAVVGLVLFLGSRGKRRASAAGRPADRLRTAREARDRAHASVAELLDGVPILDGRLTEPSARLVDGIERIQETIRARDVRLRALDEARGRLGSMDAEAHALVSSLGMAGDLDAQAAAHLLDRELRASERARDAATGAERELGRLRRECARVDERIGRIDSELEDVRLRLREIGDGDTDRGARLAAQRLRATRRADQLQEELERDRPSLSEIVTRIDDAENAGESWTMDDEDLVRRRARIEELGEEIEGLAARAEALDRDIAHAGELETTDAVDGEIATLRQEETRLIFERDRNWVLAQLVREADRRFREEHQPDLMRRASGYLEHLTGGRYDRIAADETSQGDLFHIFGPALPRPVPLTPPISTGTLEQAYLSLRLAIVDHLDQGGERLPLFVDEVLVNWDQERRARGMDVLVDVSATRQLFVFTCHDDVAADLADRGAKVLELER